MPLSFELSSKLALIPLLSATFLRTQLHSGVDTSSLRHFLSNSAPTWHLYAFSLPLSFYLSSTVAFIRLLSATFLLSQLHSGIHTPSLCHFPSNPASKWLMKEFSPRITIKMSLIAFSSAIFRKPGSLRQISPIRLR